MEVHLRCQYLTAGNVQMRGRDYDATLLVHAVKGKAISANQYATVRIDGVPVTIREANKDRAIDWFAEWAAPIVRALRPIRKVLIPVPNRRAFLGSCEAPRTALLAAAIQARLGADAVCADVLRWRRELPKSSDEASRRPEGLLPDLVLTADLPWGAIVLVDDVFTTGGHAVAAAWRLEDEMRIPTALVCCGRTLWEQLDDPFTVRPERLEIPPRPPGGDF